MLSSNAAVGSRNLENVTNFSNSGMPPPHSSKRDQLMNKPLPIGIDQLSVFGYMISSIKSRKTAMLL